MAVTTAPRPDNIEYLRTDPDLPPVGVVDHSPITPAKKAIFAAIARPSAASPRAYLLRRQLHMQGPRGRAGGQRGGWARGRRRDR